MGDKEYRPRRNQRHDSRQLKATPKASWAKSFRSRHHVPAYFDDSQRHATKDARQNRRPGGQAHHQRTYRGCSGVRSRQGEKKGRKDRRLRLGSAVRSTFHPRARRRRLRGKEYNGDTHLAALTSTLLVNYFADESRKNKALHQEDNAAMQRLRDEAEKAKIELSTAQGGRCHLPF